MRVLLIYPCAFDEAVPGVSLGVFYLAGALKRDGIKCQAIDGRVRGIGAIEAALKTKPDVVGITCLSHIRGEAFRLARLTKAISPYSTVIMGGPHVTVMHQQIQRYIPEVDLCITGDGEFPLVSYLKHGTVEYANHDLKEYPWPAWEQVEFPLYPPRGRTKRDMMVVNGVKLRMTTPVSVLSSRGCVGHCTFCSWTTWKDYRYRDPQDVGAEIKHIIDRYYQRHFEFVDDCFGADRDSTLHLCEILSSLRIAWRCNMRADRADRELLAGMKRAGCYRIFFGIESGSNTMLKGMHKRETVAQAEETIHAAKALGIYVACGFLVGLPGETDETISETRAFMRRTKPNEVNVGEGVYILPGTALYGQAKREGLIDDSFWLTDEPYKVYVNGFTTEDLSRWSNSLMRYNMRANIKTTLYRTKRWVQGCLS
jgi:anaerobic magnesium-protoporphyrin IX monomethyl ester cyclase